MTLSTSLRPRDIFFFIPNIIGYVRVATALLSFMTMKNHPIYTVVLYGVLGFLDAFDGWAARKYNQGTRFGAVLDMVTDRCATSSLIAYLSLIYPRLTFVWQVLISLDLASHYMHMYAMMTTGSASHKNVDEKQSRILSLYYTNRKFLFMVCALNEVFYVALYMHHYHFFYAGTVMAWVSAPVWLFKQFANIIQLKAAALIMARVDVEEKLKKD